MDIKNILPKWSKRNASDSGRDPLGLSRVTQRLIEKLLGGITTITPRGRYYSFYVWALWLIQNHETSDREEYLRYSLQNKDTLFALASYKKDGLNSFIGRDFIVKNISKLIDGDMVNTNYKILPSSAFGGYNQYRGPLYELGLTETPEEGTDVVTEKAINLAKVFHASIKNTQYVKERQYIKDSIDIISFNELKEFFNIDSLRKDNFAKERAELKKILFNNNNERKSSLLLFLNIVNEYDVQNIPLEVNSHNNIISIDEYLVYLPYYYSVISNNNKIIDISKQSYYKNHKSIIGIWRQFVLHEFFTRSLEAFFSGILFTLAKKGENMKIPEIVNEIINLDFQKQINEIFQMDPESPRRFLESMGIKNIPDEKISKKYCRNYSYSNVINELNIISKYEKSNSPEELFAQGITLLFLLYIKWRGNESDPAFTYILNDIAGEDLSVNKIFPYIDNAFTENQEWHVFIETILRRFVISQHARINNQKRTIGIWLEEKIDGSIVRIDDYQQRNRATRHNNTNNILFDLNLLEVKDNRMILTAEGKEYLEEMNE